MHLVNNNYIFIASLISKDLWIQKIEELDDLTDQVVVQNYYFDIPKSLLFQKNTQLQVAAGGTRYLAMMKAKNFDAIVGTALCDFASIPDPDNGY